MGDSAWHSEDENANRDVNSKNQAHKFTEGNENVIRDYTKGYVYYTLNKNIWLYFVHVLRLLL